MRIIAVLPVMLLAGCITVSERFGTRVDDIEKVHIMAGQTTESEVKDALGKPALEETDANGIKTCIWQGAHTRGYLGWMGLNWDDGKIASVTAQFKDGKATKAWQSTVKQPE